MEPRGRVRLKIRTEKILREPGVAVPLKHCPVESVCCPIGITIPISGWMYYLMDQSIQLGIPTDLANL